MFFGKAVPISAVVLKVLCQPQRDAQSPRGEVGADQGGLAAHLRPRRLAAALGLAQPGTARTQRSAQAQLPLPALAFLQQLPTLPVPSPFGLPPSYRYIHTPRPQQEEGLAFCSHVHSPHTFSIGGRRRRLPEGAPGPGHGRPAPVTRGRRGPASPA